MIKSFKSRALAGLFNKGNARKLQPKHVERLKMILAMLNAAANAGQMNAPGLRLHPLKGKPDGRYAVWVDGHLRVTFRFEAADAAEVDYGDHH